MIEGKACLILAHPGHELRLFGWICEKKPVVHILTKGSRSGTCGRIGASSAVLDQLGASSGSLFGAVYDRDLYGFLLYSEPDVFHKWTDELCDSFLACDPQFIVVDAWQLYNVAHDIMHVMARVAAAEASLQMGKPILVLDYPVVPAALEGKVPVSNIYKKYVLAPETLRRKQAIAQAFPDIGHELDEIVRLEGPSALAQEILRVPPPLIQLQGRPPGKPPYEVYGEERVKTGLYADIIRWQHVEPVVNSLLARVPIAHAEPKRA